MNRVAIILLAILTTFFVVGVVSAAPEGTEYSNLGSSRGVNPSANSIGAQAGNVTEIDINQTTITDIWQGYYGNITGKISLEDASGKKFYDWALVAPQGEVYAVRSTVPDWTLINCTNQTGIYAEEASLNITSADSDSINKTFNSTTHPGFFVGVRNITSDVCRSTYAYNASGAQSGYFTQVLLTYNFTSVIYTTIIANDENGFDSKTHDFELMVPVEKISGFSDYYFYVELT